MIFAYVAVGIIGLAVLGFLAVLLLQMPKMRNRHDMRPFLGTFFAHRGLYTYDIPPMGEGFVPENSMTAFRRAIDAGYGIETDVQVTKDGVPVLFHDDTLDRVCGQPGSIADLTYEEVTHLRLLGTDEQVPRLDDFLALVDGKVPLLVEFKLPNKASVARVIPKAMELLSAYRGKWLMETFNPLGLIYMRKHYPNVIRGQLSQYFADFPEYRKPLYTLLTYMLLNFRSKPDFLAFNGLHHRFLGYRVVHGLYKLPTAAWTIHGPVEYEMARPYFDMFIFEGGVGR